MGIDWETTHTRTHETQGFEQHGLRRRVPHLCKCIRVFRNNFFIIVPSGALAAKAARASAGILCHEAITIK